MMIGGAPRFIIRFYKVGCNGSMKKLPFKMVIQAVTITLMKWKLEKLPYAKISQYQLGCVITLLITETIKIVL